MKKLSDYLSETNVAAVYDGTVTIKGENLSVSYRAIGLLDVLGDRAIAAIYGLDQSTVEAKTEPDPFEDDDDLEVLPEAEKAKPISIEDRIVAAVCACMVDPVVSKDGGEGVSVNALPPVAVLEMFSLISEASGISASSKEGTFRNDPE